jgi:hypothetical protein
MMNILVNITQLFAGILGIALLTAIIFGFATALYQRLRNADQILKPTLNVIFKTVFYSVNVLWLISSVFLAYWLTGQLSTEEEIQTGAFQDKFPGIVFCLVISCVILYVGGGVCGSFIKKYMFKKFRISQSPVG